MVQGHRHAAAPDGAGDRRAERGFPAQLDLGGRLRQLGLAGRQRSAGGYDSNVYGVVAGIDFKVGAAGKIGATSGYAAGDIDFEQLQEQARIQRLECRSVRPLRPAAVLLPGRRLVRHVRQRCGTQHRHRRRPRWLRPHRTLVAPGCRYRLARRNRASRRTSGTADSDYSSDVWQLYGEVGWKANLGTNFSFVPFAGINWHVRRERLRSSRAGLGANLDINQATGRSLASLLGVRLTGNNLLSGNTTLIPHARIAWQHEFLDQIWSVDGRLRGQS